MISEHREKMENIISKICMDQQLTSRSEYHQNRLVRPRHPAQIQRGMDPAPLKDQNKQNMIDFDEYCDR